MRAGAVDFVVKPTSPERLEVSIKSALKIEALQGEIARIKKKAEGTLDLRRPRRPRPGHAARHRARTPRRRLQHPRADRGRKRRRQGADRARHPGRERAQVGKPFVTVNCGAIPENLVESILFGHEKGSFTGAVDKRIGKFQEADGGTLFLDEVGELPLDAQVKLLRALQEGEIDPVGVQEAGQGRLPPDLGDQPRHDPAGQGRQVPRGPLLPPQRLPDLGAAAARAPRGRAGAGAALPGPLRRRGGPARHRHQRRRRCELLTSYSWPGNVRQLENAVFRAVVLADGAAADRRRVPADRRPRRGLPRRHPGCSGAGRPAAGHHRPGDARRRGHRARTPSRSLASPAARARSASRPSPTAARSARWRRWRPT